MSIQMSRARRWLFYLAIMLTNIVILGDTVIVPITYNLYQAYPDQTWAVNFIISGPPLILSGAFYSWRICLLSVLRQDLSEAGEKNGSCLLSCIGYCCRTALLYAFKRLCCCCYAADRRMLRDCTFICLCFWLYGSAGILR